MTVTSHRMRGLLVSAKRVVAEFRTRRAVVEHAPAVQEPTTLFAADELPPVADIEAEAASFFHASEQARTAERVKRASRKLLDRLPAGQYGAWQVERVPNAREVVDLEAIRAIFKANGLGAVPMKPCAPSLKVSRVLVEAEPELVEAELRTLAGVR